MVVCCDVVHHPPNWGDAWLFPQAAADRRSRLGPWRLSHGQLAGVRCFQEVVVHASESGRECRNETTSSPTSTNVSTNDRKMMSERNTPAFEGRRGSSVELADHFYDVADESEDAFEEKKERYYKDTAFRNEVGPMIQLYDYEGEPEALWGLQIDVDLGTFGAVRGIVRECNDLEVEWRCGPNYSKDTSFTTKHEDGDAIYMVLSGEVLSKQKRKSPELDGRNKC